MGIIRNCDGLGRVCLPNEMRSQLGIQENSSVEIDIIDNSYLTIKPASDTLRTKVRSKIQFLQNQLDNESDEKEKNKIRYSIEILKDLLH